MANYGDAGTVTGKVFVAKVKQGYATDTPIPVIEEADLKKLSHPVNITLQSGKQLGALVIAKLTSGGFALCMATGSLPDSPWRTMTLNTDLTPA